MLVIWAAGETGPALDKEDAFQNAIVNQTLSKENREQVVKNGGYNE